MADVLVEFFVFLVGDVGFILGPDGLHGVEGFYTYHFACRFPDRFIVLILELFIFRDRFVFLNVHDDRIGHEIRMLFNDIANRPLVGKILIIFLLFFQFQCNDRAPSALFGLGDGEFAITMGFPAHRGISVCGFGQQCYFVSHDE